MSKYSALWNRIKELGRNELVLSYEDIERILGIEIDHSFLTCKKELKEYGYEVKKISMKNRTVTFIKTDKDL